MRKIGASNSTSGEKSVPREKFLKKCHVEHKRIRGMSWDGTKLKVDACQRKGARGLVKDVVNFELLDLNGQAPLLQSVSELELRPERFGGVNGDSGLIE